MGESDWDDDEYGDMPPYVELDDEFLAVFESFMFIELRDRGNVVYEWPDDEAAAYRDAGGFSEGTEAVHRLRAKKAVQHFLGMVENL